MGTNFKLWKLAVNSWKNNGNNMIAGQQQFTSIGGHNYNFCSSVQLHTGEILAIDSNDKTLYLVDPSLSTMKQIVNSDGSKPCCFMSITQLCDYTILLVGTNKNVYYINTVKTPSVSWNIYQNGWLNGTVRIKTIGFSNLIIQDSSKNLASVQYNESAGIISQWYYFQASGRYDGAQPMYDNNYQNILCRGNNNNKMYVDTYYLNTTSNGINGNLVELTQNPSCCCLEFMWFDNDRIKPDILTNYSIDLPIKDGLFSYYNSDSFLNGIWYDLTTNLNNVVYLSNNIQKNSNFIYGDTSSFMIFPYDVLTNNSYTLFHLTKYNGNTKGRILQGLKNDWTSGFLNNNAGVAYHGNWITDTKNVFNNDWVLSTDQLNLYRANMHNFTTSSSSNNILTQLAINTGYTNEKSDWACACIIVFNRELSKDEILLMESWIVKKYSGLFANNMNSLGFKNFYNIDDNNQIIGKINYSTVFDEQNTIRNATFTCPSLDGINCINQNNEDYINMKNFGNIMPVLPSTTQISCEFTFDKTKKPADTFKFINKNGNIRSEDCQKIFDRYNLYPTNNPLAIIGPDSNAKIYNKINNSDELETIASIYNYKNTNTDEQIIDSINEVLNETPLKLACCRRLQSNNSTLYSSYNGSLSPNVAVQNETLNKLNFQSNSYTLPPNSCPANLYGGSSDCDAFFGSYCANMYDYLQSKGFNDNDKLNIIPECACLFPPTVNQKPYASQPAVCYKNGCISSGKSYLDSSSRQTGTYNAITCNSTICQNIINASGIDAGGNVSINSTLNNQCGQQINAKTNNVENTNSSQSQQQSQTKSQPQTQPQTESQTKSQPQTESQTKSQPQTESQTKSQPQTESQTKSQPQTQPQIQPQTQPQTQTESQTQTNPSKQAYLISYILLTSMTISVFIIILIIFYFIFRKN